MTNLIKIRGIRKLIFTILLPILLSMYACGGGGGDTGSSPTPVLPSVDVTGVWSGPYYSSLFGSPNATLTLQQVEASVTGSYSSSAGGLGSISGSMSGDTISFTMRVTTPGCSGSFTGTGKVHVPTAGFLTMSFSFSGSSTCGGSESGTGTLRAQNIPPITTTTDIIGTYRLTEYLDLYTPDTGGPYSWSHTADSFSGTMTIEKDNISQVIIKDKSSTGSGLQYTGTGAYTVSGGKIILHNMSYTIKSIDDPHGWYDPLVGASNGGIYVSSDNILTTYSGVYPKKSGYNYTKTLYSYWTRQ
jgi:hypothetical protein